MTTTARKTREITTDSARTADVGSKRAPPRSLHLLRLMSMMFILPLAGVLSQHSAVSAQPEPHVLTVAPSVRELSVLPGKSVDTSVTVANKGSKGFEYTLTLAPYSVLDESYEAVFTPIDGQLPVQSWFEIDAPLAGKLDVSGYIDVPMTLTVPADTAPGGYAAALMVESSQRSDGQGVAIRNRIAHIVYVTVEGPVEQQGFVDVISPPLLGINQNIPISVRANNTGGTNERIKVQVSVHDVWGELLFTETRERFSIPATSRLLDFDWTAPAKMVGIYRVAYEWEFAGTSGNMARWAVVMSPWFVLMISLMVLLTVASIFTRRQRRKRQR